MKIGDILDMRKYLSERCYCPNEIYSLDGFFFQIFDADSDCEVLCEGQRGDIHGTFIIANPKEGKKQIIYVEHDGKTVSDCIRFDATENNKKQFRTYLNGERDKLFIDEYENEVKPLDELGGKMKELEKMSNEELAELANRCQKIVCDREDEEERKAIEDFHKAFDEVMKYVYGVRVKTTCFNEDIIEATSFDDFYFHD